MFSKSGVSLIYDRPEKGFFTVNDKITGKVIISNRDFLSFNDIQVKLKCEELAPRESHPRRGMRSASKRNRRMGLISSMLDIDLNDVNPMYRLDFKTETYFSTATNAKPSSSTSSKNSATGDVTLDPGTHEFPFELVLSQAIQKCPPHCPFLFDDDLRYGFIWTIKASVYRSGLKRNMRDVKDVPVIPNLSQPPSRSINYRTLTETVLSKYKAKRFFKRKQQIDVALKYPDDGISQDRLSNFKLMIDAPGCSIVVDRIEMNVMRALKLNYTIDPRSRTILEERYELGTIRIRKQISRATDLTSLVSEFRLKNIVPPPATGKYIQTEDFLELIIECSLQNEREEKIKVYGPTRIMSPSGYTNPNYPRPTIYELPHPSSEHQGSESPYPEPVDEGANADVKGGVGDAESKNEQAPPLPSKANLINRTENDKSDGDTQPPPPPYGG